MQSWTVQVQVGIHVCRFAILKWMEARSNLRYSQPEELAGGLPGQMSNDQIKTMLQKSMDSRQADLPKGQLNLLLQNMDFVANLRSASDMEQLYKILRRKAMEAGLQWKEGGTITTEQPATVLPQVAPTPPETKPPPVPKPSEPTQEEHDANWRSNRADNVYSVGTCQVGALFERMDGVAFGTVSDVQRIIPMKLRMAAVLLKPGKTTTGSGLQTIVKSFNIDGTAHFLPAVVVQRGTQLVTLGLHNAAQVQPGLTATSVLFKIEFDQAFIPPDTWKLFPTVAPSRIFRSVKGSLNGSNLKFIRKPLT